MSDPRSALLTALEGLHQIAKYYSLLPDIKLETEMRSFYVHLWARCLELYNQIATMLNFEPRSEFLETFSSLLESLIDVDRLRSHGKLIEVAAPYSGFGALRHIINTERNQEDQVQFLQDCIDFRAGEKRATLLNLLKGGIVGLKTQTYDFILEEDVPFHTRARPKPPDKIHPAASSLFQVLESRKRCSCHLPHEYVVQLCLETHRSNYDFDTDSNFEFNCAFNFGCGFNLSIGLREMLHEAQVQTIIPLSSNEDSAESSQSRHPPVKKLCGVIKVAMGSNYRLRFHSENGNLWRLCSEESSSKIDRSKPPISLTQIMVKNPKALTEKTKRVLSVLLGHAVFHLHETPWLQSPWSLSNVMFFETSSGLPLRPYIRARPNAGPSGGLGGHAETDEDDEFNPDANILPPCPCLVDLAIALMELYKAESIDSLAGTYGISAISQTDPKLRYASVREVFKCCQTDIADQTREAIRSCLAPGIREDDHGKELNDLELRSVIYQRIVRRLEDELQTGFSDLSIEKLDESAQNMDLNKGGQPICKEQANQSFHKSVSASKLEQQTSDKPSGRRVRFARDDDENLHQGRSSTLAEQSKSSSQRDKGLCHNNLLSVNGCIEQGSVASTRGRLHTRPNTIRVSNIPHDISEPQLAAKLRSFFGSECKVHSLARASRDTYWWNCATVTFPSIPNQDLDSLIEKEKHRPRDLSKRILYDTHFLGITALYDAGEKATIDN
ncbi:hypothetical protein F5B19DRAFT_342270 [Rostrohypoxylon terebratum]|nr:hypothetical protein F5B19DRAFT_342270 [Rostrohypoxylon terebratum]